MPPGLRLRHPFHLPLRMVRLRQLVDQIRHRLLFIPAVFGVAAILLAQGMLRLDASLADDSLPQTLQTTVAGGRAILTAIAGGLITSITLLLSMTMVAVQLASSQFSPRSIRNWIGDRTQQRAIGVVLGTTVYCLLVLRETRTFAEGDELIPHLSVIVALVLGLVSLVAVVRSVDHLTDKLRVGNIASTIAADTIAMIRATDRIESSAPLDGPVPSTPSFSPPENAAVIEAPHSGWVQQIDRRSLLDTAPEGSTIHIPVAVGDFVPREAPLAFVAPAPDEHLRHEMQADFALGDQRTMQSDVGFGVLLLVDIALRALSPGVNDPNTANEMVVRLGDIMLTVWAQPAAPTVVEHDGRRIVSRQFDHRDHLEAAFEPIRHHSTDEPLVATTLLRTLEQLEDETRRRGLVGPVEPIQEMIQRVIAGSSVSLADNSSDS